MKIRAAVASISLVLVSTLVTSSIAPEAQAFGIKDEWRAPPKFANKRNPYPPGPHSLEIGQALYYDECRQCHGQSGLGDGELAGGLTSHVIDLNRSDVISQSDGELFWKISKGRGEMPGYKRKLSKDEIWHLINFMRSEFN